MTTKSEGALLTIGEMAAQLGVKPHILRYWEDQFPALRPLKRAGGRRYYRVEDVALLRTIAHMLYDEGYTIAGVRKALNRRGGVVSPPASDATDDMALRSGLLALRRRLAGLL